MQQNIIECDVCGALLRDRQSTAAKVVCSDCVIDIMRQHDSPVKKKQASAQGYPKGWRFKKEFVHANGTVYHRGVEQPELKGTLQPTTIKVKPKKSKAQKAQEKQQTLQELGELKKQLKKATAKTTIKKIQTQIKKLEKRL